MDVDLELSQQLQGHESQVRCVAVLTDGSLVTGGLDSQVILWKKTEGGFELNKKLGHHSDFVYALTPSHSSPGCFYSGSKDKTAFFVDGEGNPTRQFVGHEGPVCSLVERGTQLITGSWDGTARIWDASTGELRSTLDAGAHAVTVAVLPSGEVVTGSQDRSLRVFRGTECVTKVPEAHSDIIRAISTSSSNLLTASNDNEIKMWSFDGVPMANITGHQSFVYGVTHASDNATFLSSSDDCSLKVWSLSDMSCKQSIVHAGTVWQSASLPNGDVVTCCADMMVRVWSRDPARMASEGERQTQREIAEQAAIAASAKGSSSVPMEGTEDISKMPSTVGKKNGEIKCFKDGGTVFAFSWNAGARQWDKIGEVVGSESQKKFYEGDPVFPRGEYDFVFDVDMGAQYGMRKLPYNKGENPMVVAESFCVREQINKSNVDQIRQFIIQNAGGGGDAPMPQAPAAAAPPPPPKPQESTMFPVMQPAVFKDGKYDPLQAKITEFNNQVDDGVKLSGEELSHLVDAIGKLKMGVSTQFLNREKEVVMTKLKEWPAEKFFPVMDLWRLVLCHPVSSDFFKGSDRGAAYIQQALNFLALDVNGPLALCCTRFLSNLFIYQTNRYAAFDKRDLIMKTIEPALSSTNKHVKVACNSILLNIAIVLHESSLPPKAWDAASAVQVATLSLSFLEKAGADDGDAQSRALFAIGSLLPRDKQNGNPVTKKCTEAGLQGKLAGLESKAGANVVAEIRTLLQ